MPTTVAAPTTATATVITTRTLKTTTTIKTTLTWGNDTGHNTRKAQRHANHTHVERAIDRRSMKWTPEVQGHLLDHLLVLAMITHLPPTAMFGLLAHFRALIHSLFQSLAPKHMGKWFMTMNWTSQKSECIADRLTDQPINKPTDGYGWVESLEYNWNGIFLP